MDLHILLAGVEFGPYTDDQARELLGEGFLSATDPAKRLDELEWLPLDSVLAHPREKAPAPNPPQDSSPLDEEPEPGPAPAEEASALPEIFAGRETSESYPPEEAQPSAPPAETEEAREALAEERPEAISPVLTEDAPVSPLPQGATREPSAPLPRAMPPSAPKTSFTSFPPQAGVPERRVAAPPRGVNASSPLLFVSLPSRAKKAMRTGSLLAGDALRAAQAQSGILQAATPSTSLVPPSTAPEKSIPKLEPAGPLRDVPSIATSPLPAPAEEQPARKKVPLILRNQEGTGPLPPDPTSTRKAIRLTGRITLPGLAPKPELSEPQRPPQTGPLFIGQLARRTQATGLSGPPAGPGKSPTGFSGTIARPADLAGEGGAPRPQTDRVVFAHERTAQLKGPSLEPALPPAAPEPPSPITRPPEPEAPHREPAFGSVTALLRAAGTETVAEPPDPSLTGDLPSVDAAEPEDETSGEPLTASGILTASGDLAERRSLKITGPLRHPLPRIPIRLGPAAGSSEAWAPQPAAERPPSSPLPFPVTEARPYDEPPAPAPEESLPPRPSTGKIPVADMPTEGVRIRSRRITTKVPLPDSLGGASGRLAEPVAPPKIEPIAGRTAPALPVEPVAPPAPARTGPVHRLPISITPPPQEETADKETSTSPESSSSGTLPGPVMDVAPMAGEEGATETLESPGPAAASESTTVARPEKVRLRRPVKLELASRPKIQDSGRLTLEAFSKMASLEPAVGSPTRPLPAPVAIVPPLVREEAVTSAPGVAAKTETPEKPPQTDSPWTVPAANPVPVLDDPVYAARPPRRKTPWRLEWLAYAVIAIGVIAACIIVYLTGDRPLPAEMQPAPSLEDATTVSTSPPAPHPASTAAPPAPVNPPAAASPPASAAPPTALAPSAPANPAPVTNSVLGPIVTTPTPPPPDVDREVSAYVHDGILKHQSGDSAGAIDALNQALDLDPNSAEALYNRGISKAALNDLDGAIADYSAALEIQPNLGGAYYYRGLARHSKAELDGAVADYNQAVKIDPKNALAYFNRGLIRMQKDDIDGAIVDSTRALEIDPRLIQTYYDRGLGRLAKGAMDASLSDMKAFCQLAPQDAYTDYARLYIWLIETRQGQMAEANQELSKAMNSGWNGAADSMVTRIGEYLLGQMSQAELVKAASSSVPIKDQGQRCEVWYFIGMRQLEAGDRAGGKEDLLKCLGTQKIDYCEYILAEEQLKSLDAANPGSPAPAASASTPAPPPQPVAPRAQPVTLPDPGMMNSSGPATTP